MLTALPLAYRRSKQPLPAVATAEASPPYEPLALWVSGKKVEPCARVEGLEPPAFSSVVRRSNPLSYTRLALPRGVEPPHPDFGGRVPDPRARARRVEVLRGPSTLQWVRQGSNLRQLVCKTRALPTELHTQEVQRGTLGLSACLTWLNFSSPPWIRTKIRRVNSALLRQLS